MAENLIELYDLHENDKEFHDKFSYWLWSVICDNDLTQVALRDELELSQTQFSRMLHRTKDSHFSKMQYVATMTILTFYHEIDCRPFKEYFFGNLDFLKGDDGYTKSRFIIKGKKKLEIVKSILDYWDDDEAFYEYFRDQLWILFLAIKPHNKNLAIELEKNVSKGLHRNKIRFLYVMALLCNYPGNNNSTVKKMIYKFFVEMTNWPMYKGVYCNE